MMFIMLLLTMMIKRGPRRHFLSSIFVILTTTLGPYVYRLLVLPHPDADNSVLYTTVPNSPKTCRSCCYTRRDRVLSTFDKGDREDCLRHRAFDEETSLITELPDVRISSENGKAPAIELCTDETKESNQSETEKTVYISPAIQVDPEGVHSKLSPLKPSPCKFLLDPLAWAVLIYLGPGLAGIFSAQLLVMDIAENKGFPEHGLTLVTAVVIAGLVGKVLSGVLSLCRTLSSFVLLAAVGVLGSEKIFLLGSVSSLPATMTSISGLGISLGTTVSVFPKCCLDMPSVDVSSYPLALGVASTTEGIFDFLCSVLVGKFSGFRTWSQ